MEQIVIELKKPLKQGEQEISQLTLTKPTVRALRNIALLNVFQLDITTLLTLTQRIATPHVTKQTLEQLDTTDLVKLSNEVANFFADTE